MNLDEEPLALRERYGLNIYGQRVLMARRLIEAGARIDGESRTAGVNHQVQRQQAVGLVETVQPIMPVRSAC